MSVTPLSYSLEMIEERNGVAPVTLAAKVMSASLAHDRWASDTRRQGGLRPPPGSRLVLLNDEDYPEALRAIAAAPTHLYVVGPLNKPGDRHAVAIVGSRNASPAAISAAADLARVLAGRGHTIVSGLAAGVDTAAHGGALEAGGRTIAVLGTGIDQTFPPSNVHLRDRIAQHGAIISQFDHGQPPSKTTFPVRNVLIAGLSRVSVLIELAESSGTRIEATVALEQGKPVLLWAPLLAHLKWARKFASHRLVEFVDSADEVVEALERPV